MTTTFTNLATLDQIKANLGKWDELSPLNEQQLKSVIVLADLNQLQTSSSSLPDEWSSASDVAAKQSAITPTNTSSVPTTPLSGGSSSSGRGNINEDINELLYNFDINDIEDPRIDRYVQTLQRNSRKCGQISDSIETAFNQLGVLLDNYEHVSQKTRSLHVACEQLLSDQVNELSLLALKLYYV